RNVLLLLLAQSRNRVHDDAIDSLLNERVDVMHLFARIHIAVAEQNIKTSYISCILRTACHISKIRITNVANDQANGVGSPCNQAARETIGLVIEMGGSLKYAFPRIRMNSVCPIQSPRRCCERNPGCIGNILQPGANSFSIRLIHRVSAFPLAPLALGQQKRNAWERDAQAFPKLNTGT